MLDVVFYHTTQDLIEAEIDSVKPLIICPSPLVADGLRRLMRPEVEIITISKWVSDYLKQKNLRKANKAELMLRLSSVWRHYFPEEDHQIFLRSFEVFTDLRSFTLNMDLLSEFLNELDTSVRKSILIFWAFLTNESIVDEHKSYQLIGQFNSDRALWFIGFKHLSGVQIDMLKDLGEKVNVNVFFPKDVYSEALSTDWIKWIIPEFKIEIEPEAPKTKIAFYPKNKLNYVLESLEKNFPAFDLSLASSQLEFKDRQEVFSPGQFFKSPEDLFSLKREILFDELSAKVGRDKLSLTDLLVWIGEKKKNALQVEDFITYKIHTLLEEALGLYGEFQQAIDDFSLKILKIIIELNSPRISLATLEKSAHRRLFELNELPFRLEKTPLMIIASSNYGSLKSGDGVYSEKMIDALKTIAPVKRGGLEFAFLKYELRTVLKQSDCFLLMEEGLDQTDLAWKEILKDFSIEFVHPQIEFKLKDKRDYLAERMKKGPFEVSRFSASRVQAFHDCPRKYYFSYHERLEHRPEVRLELGSDEMGTLEHKIIQSYFEARRFSEEYDSGLHRRICQKELQSYLESKPSQLDEQSRLLTYFELINYSQAGIEYLIQYCRENVAKDIQFEVKVKSNEWSIEGSIDCIVELEDGRLGVFDFKRSSAAAGSKVETLEFEKIQIWIYVLYLVKVKKASLHTWGYLNLSEIAKSTLFCEAKEQNLSDERLDKFEGLLLDLENKIKIEENFFPHPRHEDVCKFCEVNLVCPRSIQA